MKSFKSLVNNIEEAMGGKRNENFTGDDEIGDFWVVTKADKISILADILFDADIFDIHLQINGGLKGSDIVGIYKKEAKARKVAEKQLAKFN